MTLSTEHQAVVDELRATVKSVCQTLGGPECARRAIDTGTPGADPDGWKILSGQLGIAALGLPEIADGVGGLPELLAVSEELGAALLPVPFFGSTVLAGQTLSECGPAAYPALQSMAAGEVFALAAAKRHAADQHPCLRLGRDARVTGVATTVLNGLQAHWLVAETPDALVLIDLRDPECHVTPSVTLDLTRSFATVAVESARCTILRDAPTDAPNPALARAALALAAEQIGGAQACLEMTVAYVKERHQFSRPIGSFQAIKHTLADALVKIELGRSALIRALEMSASCNDLTEAAAVARIWCTDAYRFVTAETIQLHGGIGFTWEHDAHLYFRRARSDALLLGSTSTWRDTLAATLSW
jgi:alkylation response protein AidB-like acyl-CoA dehydrogenase